MGSAYLQWQHHQGNTNENDHQQLGGPDLGRDVAVADRGEGDDAEVKGVKQGKLFSSSFQMLDPTSSEEDIVPRHKGITPSPLYRHSGDTLHDKRLSLLIVHTHGLDFKSMLLNVKQLLQQNRATLCATLQHKNITFSKYIGSFGFN